MRSLSKNLFWAIGVFLFLAFIFSVLFGFETQKIETLSIDQLVKKINAGEIKSIEVAGSDLEIILKNEGRAQSKKEGETSLTETLKNYGINQEALQNVELKIKTESGFKYWAGVLLPALLPVLIMILIFWWIFRQARTGVNQAFSFGKINLRLFAPSRDKISFKDVAGLKESKEELEEIVDFLRHPKKFLEIGARIPRGVLLMGPPGTGKTSSADQVFDYQNQGPDYWAGLWQGAMQQFSGNVTEAKLSLLRHDIEMQRKLRGGE